MDGKIRQWSILECNVDNALRTITVYFPINFGTIENFSVSPLSIVSSNFEYPNFYFNSKGANTLSFIVRNGYSATSRPCYVTVESHI